MTLDSINLVWLVRLMMIRDIESTYQERRAIIKSFDLDSKTTPNTWSSDDLRLVRDLTAQKKIKNTIPLRGMVVKICQDLRVSVTTCDFVLFEIFEEQNREVKNDQ